MQHKFRWKIWKSSNVDTVHFAMLRLWYIFAYRCRKCMLEWRYDFKIYLCTVLHASNAVSVHLCIFTRTVSKSLWQILLNICIVKICCWAKLSAMPQVYDANGVYLYGQHSKKRPNCRCLQLTWNVEILNWGQVLSTRQHIHHMQCGA